MLRERGLQAEAFETEYGDEAMEETAAEAEAAHGATVPETDTG